MDEKAASGGAVKLIVVSAAVIIVLLIVIKELGLTPSEMNAGSVGVKFQNILPPQQQATPQSTAELEKKVRDLQESVQNANKLQNVSRTSDPPPGETIVAPAPTIAGYWQANPYVVQITQFGNQVGMTVLYQNGVPGAVCQGTLNGKSLQMNCTNGIGSSPATGDVISNNRIELTDFGYGQRWLLVR